MSIYFKIIIILISLLIIMLISSFCTLNPYILIDDIVFKLKHNRKSIKNLLKQENEVNDQEAKNFLRKEFGKNFEDKFNYFKSGPHKADLWRLCSLYKYGGCYLDVDVEMNKSFDYIINQIKEDFIVADTLVGFKNKRVFNALMICKPGDKMIGECIKRIMLIKQRYLDFDYHYIIYVMTSILEEKLKNNKLLEMYKPSNNFNFIRLSQDYYLTINEEIIGKSKRKDY